jgi:hypothetical protein
MELSEQQDKKTNHDNLLRIADELDAICENASLSGEALKREIKKALKPKLYWPHSPTIQKLFDDICDLYARHAPDLTDEIIRHHLVGCVLLIRTFLN